MPPPLWVVGCPGLGADAAPTPGVEWRAVLASALLAVVVFAADLTVPAQVAVPIAYGFALIPALRLPRRGALVVAGTASALSVVAALIGLGFEDGWIAPVNRLLGLAALWSAALLIERGRPVEPSPNQAVTVTEGFRQAQLRFLTAVSHDLRRPVHAAVLFH
ncbi:MAG: hypothetical protein HQL37_16285, partial [Alphaproteobacteria bacterium]|nr:hypothetical protein [Alphaproteobacteria bacterium]